MVLFGCTGVGKTAVGERLAARLGVPFRDLDHDVEQAAGCAVWELFARAGEEGFRAAERRCFGEALNASGDWVLSVGGGAIQAEKDLDAVRSRARLVVLEAHLDTLVDRVARSGCRRPKLVGGDLRDRIAELLRERAVWYDRGDVRVATDGKTVEEVAEAVQKILAEGSETR